MPNLQKKSWHANISITTKFWTSDGQLKIPILSKRSRSSEDSEQEAIKARMDPLIVDAMRSVRVLEEGIVMDDEDQYEDEDEQEADVQQDPKRRRLENGPADSPAPPPNPSGLLSADTV